MKKFMDEFKKFITKGNALDLAIGVIIGGAFGKIVNSLVADIIMPPIGMLLGKVDFNNLYLQLNKAVVSIPKGTPLSVAQEQGAVVVAYGSFLMAIINFLIIAFFIFLVVKGIARRRFPWRQPAVPTVHRNWTNLHILKIKRAVKKQPVIRLWTC